MRTKKEIKAYLKRVKKGASFSMMSGDTCYTIVKFTDNKYLVYTSDNLILELLNNKVYTKHNLINLLYEGGE